MLQIFFLEFLSPLLCTLPYTLIFCTPCYRLFWHNTTREFLTSLKICQVRAALLTEAETCCVWAHPVSWRKAPDDFYEKEGMSWEIRNSESSQAPGARPTVLHTF